MKSTHCNCTENQNRTHHSNKDNTTCPIHRRPHFSLVNEFIHRYVIANEAMLISSTDLFGDDYDVSSSKNPDVSLDAIVNGHIPHPCRIRSETCPAPRD